MFTYQINLTCFLEAFTFFAIMTFRFAFFLNLASVISDKYLYCTALLVESALIFPRKILILIFLRKIVRAVVRAARYWCTHVKPALNYCPSSCIAQLFS